MDGLRPLGSASQSVRGFGEISVIVVAVRFRRIVNFGQTSVDR
jgi:hypothetical protein